MRAGDRNPDYGIVVITDGASVKLDVVKSDVTLSNSLSIADSTSRVESIEY